MRQAAGKACIIGTPPRKVYHGRACFERSLPTTRFVYVANPQVLSQELHSCRRGGGKEIAGVPMTADATVIRCANCQSENSFDAEKCHSCGHFISQSFVKKNTTTCRFCSTENPNDEQYCKSCGSHMIHGTAKNNSKEVSQDQAKSKFKPAMFIVGAASVLFLLDAYSMITDMSFFLNFVLGLPFRLRIYVIFSDRLLLLSCLVLGVLGIIKCSRENFAERLIEFASIYAVLLFAVFFVNMVFSLSFSMTGFIGTILGLVSPVLYIVGAMKW